MKHQYEAMFLFDPGFAGDVSKAEKEIRRVMDRAEAQIVFCRKWDERRLAYEIEGRRRGVYLLVYFKAAPDKIKGLERDAQLSEPILRLLVLRADDITPERMEHFAPQPARPAPEPEPAEETPARHPDAGEMKATADAEAADAEATEVAALDRTEEVPPEEAPAPEPEPNP